jgi:hypothetical protein
LASALTFQRDTARQTRGGEGAREIQVASGMGDFYDYDEYEEADGEVSLRDECTTLCGDFLGPGASFCLSTLLSCCSHPPKWGWRPDRPSLLPRFDLREESFD